MEMPRTREDKRFHIAVIGSYPELAQKIVEMAKEMDVVVDNYYAKFKEAAEIAKRIEPCVDAIISRGNTTLSIQTAVSIPVVNVSVSPFDLILALEQMGPQAREKVAFFNHERRLYGIRDIERLYKIKIEEYVVRSQEDLRRGMAAAKKQGVQVAIGGNAAVEVAEEMGLHGVEVSGGEEAIYNALRETIRLIRLSRAEHDRSEWLHTMLDSLSEGIVVEGPDGKAIMHNRAMPKLLRMNPETIDGRQVKTFLPGSGRRQKQDAGQEASCLLDINGSKIAYSTIPVHRDGECIAKVYTFEDVTRIQKLERQVRMELHKRGFAAKYHFPDILTESKEMQSAIQEALLYAESDAAILIEGESGTGKELFAQSIHNSSLRKDGPFVAINCAALPESLLESELFGYEAGAFSGAKREGHAGLFEMAHNGTIFLDEIGELPLTFQTKLLRVLQEKEVHRIGGNKVIPVDIRIISATNRNLRKQIDRGEFRGDLYYRLNVFHVSIPPLRERRGDIELLLRSFLREKMALTPVQEEKLQELLPRLKTHDWPGNVRELRNIAERMELYLQNLNNEKVSSKIVMQSIRRTMEGHSISIDVDISQGLKSAREQAEREIIDRVCELYEGDQQQILKILDVGRTTLWRKKGDVPLSERDV